MRFVWAAALTLLTLAVTQVTQVTSASAQGMYQIRPGDTLRVEVIEDDTLNRDVLVAPDGRISVPLAGSIMAAGRTIGQVETQLTSALADDFEQRPTVFVGVASLREEEEQQEPEVIEVPAPEPPTVDVYVLGEVANPGKLEVEPGTTVLQLFSLVGGFGDFAATKRIQLRRDLGSGEQIYRLNYEDIEAGTSPNGSVQVTEGDTFIVPTRRLFE